MIDREKVIKGLESCRKTDCANCEYNTEVCLIDEIISDAIAMLKEQDDEIKELRSMVEFWKEKALHT